MPRSLIYQYPLLYEAVMAGLYGRHFRARQAFIANLIPERASVLDVCCGPGSLYTRHLKRRMIHYTGIDINERFVARVRRAGATALFEDVSHLERLPAADFVIMQSSLYQFLPNVEGILQRMLDASQVNLIVSEPIRNLTDSPVPLLRWLGRKGTDPGTGATPDRFTATSLRELFGQHQARILQHGKIPGGREMFFVLRGRHYEMHDSPDPD